MSTLPLILTVIGDDRPGLVEQLATAISAHQGNWLESSMAHLSGKFAGIVEVDVPQEQETALRATLAAMPTLRVSVERSEARQNPAAGRQMSLSLVGHDRIGIVREVSAVLARHGVNVEALNTFTASAPMSAEVLFHAEADLFAFAGLDTHALQHDLESLGDDLMVELAFVGDDI